MDLLSCTLSNSSSENDYYDNWVLVIWFNRSKFLPETCWLVTLYCRAYLLPLVLLGVSTLYVGRWHNFGLCSISVTHTQNTFFNYYKEYFAITEDRSFLSYDTCSVKSSTSLQWILILWSRICETNIYSLTYSLNFQLVFKVCFTKRLTLVLRRGGGRCNNPQKRFRPGAQNYAAKGKNCSRYL